jgi:hypothetical protein
MNSQ